MPKICVVMIDDEEMYLQMYEKLLAGEYRFFGAADVAGGVKLIRAHRPAVLLLDVALKTDHDTAGLEALAAIKRESPGLKIIMVTNRDSYLISREAEEAGASAYFVKRENLGRLKEMIDSLALELTAAQEPDGVIAVAPNMRQLLQEARRYARSEAHLLISGESGAGKGVIARYIHRHSRRKDKPFVVVNCAEIPSNLLADELFGHVKGAYTGAHLARAGKFEAAEGGSVFLDEIAELRREDQAKLLRIAESKVVQRIGSNKDIPLDVRIISATNKPLPELLDAGQFRLDLYHRLRQLSLHVPPLRERREDIIPLAQHFLRTIAGQEQKQEKTLAHSALAALKAYDWKGNVRELQNVLTEAFWRCPQREITAAYLRLESASEGIALGLRDARHEFERAHVQKILAAHKGNITGAAKTLGLSRQGLQKKLRELGLAAAGREDE